MFIDPTYLILVGPAIVLSIWASFKTKSAFKKYSKVRVVSGQTGAQAAKSLLQGAGIGDVEIKPIRGNLSDHYNPVTKTLALSEAVYGSSSVAAVGVACHEAGHAIQHAQAYKPLWFRSLLVKPTQFASKFAFWGIMIGLILQMNGLFQVGVILFSVTLVFQLVTLPVEFDASNRAKKLALANGIVVEQERSGMDKVLNAAALTYVAAAAMTLMQLIYFLGLRRD